MNLRSVLQTLFPFVRYVSLSLADLKADLVAGATVAFLIVPPAAAHMLTDRLWLLLILAVGIGAGSSAAGYLVAARLDASIAGCMAAAMGAFLRNPEARLELLRDATPNVRSRAKALVDSGNCEYACLEDQPDFHVRVEVEGQGHRSLCVLSGSHTRIERVERDGDVVQRAARDGEPSDSLSYRDVLKAMTLERLLQEVCELDDEDRRSAKRREMASNLAREVELYRQDDDEPIRGVVQNLSISGMQIRTHDSQPPRLRPGERVRLVVHLPRPVGGINRMVTIARIAGNRNPRHLVIGIAFEREVPGLAELLGKG